MASPIELRNALEDRQLPVIAKTVAQTFVRQAIHAYDQPVLSSGMMTIHERRFQEMQTSHPREVVVPNRQFDQLRYQAAVAASGLSDDQIESAPGNSMWRMVLDETRLGILGSSYQMSTDTIRATPKKLVKILMTDYTESRKTG